MIDARLCLREAALSLLDIARPRAAAMRGTRDVTRYAQDDAASRLLRRGAERDMRRQADAASRHMRVTRR